MKSIIAFVAVLAAVLLLAVPSRSDALPGAPRLVATATPATPPEPTPVPPVTKNEQWTPVHREFDGVDMVLVPPGCFTMGSPDGDDDEKPASEVCLDVAYWMDATEVTNAQFEPFQAKFAYPGDWPGPDQPRDYLSWLEADKYCALRGARLPTEAEWEFAARGPDGLAYPWGAEFVEDNAVFRSNSGDVPADVGSKPGGVSWVGALDMLGNLAEWTSSQYQPYPYIADDGREASADEGGNEYRVHRGGAFTQPAEMLSTTDRNYARPDSRQVYVGVRCARSIH